MTQFLQIAHLNPEDVTRIRALEAELDRHIMAFEPGLEIADLDEDALATIQALEEELGVTLLVYAD